jgi:hypothetical protein
MSDLKPIFRNDGKNRASSDQPGRPGYEGDKGSTQQKCPHKKLGIHSDL